MDRVRPSPLPCPVALRGVALVILGRCHEVTEELKDYMGLEA